MAVRIKTSEDTKSYVELDYGLRECTIATASKHEIGVGVCLNKKEIRELIRYLNTALEQII